MGCGDEAFVGHEHVTTETHTHLATEHDDDHADDCSPFCSCACCSIQTTFPFNQTLTFQFIDIPSYHQLVVRYLFSVSEFRHSFWQPPKIG